jgi:hypothetical protein
MDRIRIFLTLIILTVVWVTVISVSHPEVSSNIDPLLNNTTTGDQSTAIKGELLGGTDFGEVFKEGSYGNSSFSIAYLVGTDPLKSEALERLTESIKCHEIFSAPCPQTSDSIESPSNDATTENQSAETDEDEFLGSTDYGEVQKEGPYGNISSPVKIAYIVGVHPLESKAHTGMVESIKSRDKSLKYCYYIYKVEVTKGANNREQGRMNGQLLANKYAVNDIMDQNFRLVVDVHSNSEYTPHTYVFSPINGNTADFIVNGILDHISWLSYYYPPKPTSTNYITIPLSKSGTSSIVYEIYEYQTSQNIRKQADEFLITVDNLNIENQWVR